jgi:hypothetical protein
MDYSDEIVLFMDEQAENGFDEEFDTKKMFTDNKLYPQVYFITDKKELAIQGIKPLEDEEKFIPLGVQTNKPGLFEISAENPEVFDPTLEVYLKDKTNEKIINLRMDSYRFKAGSSASITDRFSLILSKGNYTSVNKTNSAGMKVWFYKKRLYIQSARTGEVDLKITDITGRIVQNKRIALQRGTNSVPLNEKTGIYLVYIKINNEIHTRKILLK